MPAGESLVDIGRENRVCNRSLHVLNSACRPPAMIIFGYLIRAFSCV